MKCSMTPSTCIFPPTYMTTTSIITVNINNNSDKCLNYEWRKCANEDEESKKLLNCDIYDPRQRSNYSSLLLFDSEYFSFEKKSATVWPQRSEQINVYFKPHKSIEYKSTAYLYNKETKQRIPYTIIGRGLPSNAEFNISEINISHVALESQYDYKVQLINKGKIPLSFEFVDRQINSGLKFQFSPKNGYIAVGDSNDIYIHFEANYLGQFKETFNFKTSYDGVTGNSPSITFFGRVMGPSYSISPLNINFGIVSYGFLFTKEFEIKNTSEIPFDYNLILRQDTTFDAREFNLYPDTSLVNGNSEQKIRIEFIPISVQKYDIWLDVHSMKCDDDLASIHIVAECICPKISIVDSLINLETVFIGHQYQTFLKLQNDTDYPAKYEFVEATDQSILDADLTATRINGIIHSHKVSEVALKFKPLELGHINLNRYIKIFGSDEPPLPFTVSALSVGPDIIINSEKVNFGTINVLIETTQKFQIFNKSLIPAPFKCEIESKSGVFKIFPEEATIQPNETFYVAVTAYLDDSVQFNGKISLFFQNLLPIYLDVVAKGTGTVIVPNIDMSIINFGYIFTEQKAIKEFIYENQGRRAQEIKFAQQKPRFDNMDTKSPVFEFSIEPSEVVIQPYCSQVFKISLSCKSSGNFSMTLPCHTTIQKKRIDLYKTLLKGTFIKPFVSFDDNLMVFNYMHNVNEEEKLTGNVITQQPIIPSIQLMKQMTLTNSITNRSELPLEIVVQKEFPFTLSKYKFELDVGETESFDVFFDPSYKKSFSSEIVNKRIAFGFNENPAKFYLNVRANMNFPNLSFSATSIDFGSLLKHTEDTRTIQLTNNGELDVEYEWELTYAENAAKIFDIYPIRGKIEKNKTEDSTFTFFAIGKDELFGTAVCHVKGGPEYTINLRGSSSDISFKIEPELIDFGNRMFNEVLTSSLILRNTSTVSVEYGVLIPKGSGFGEFSVHPMSGQIQSGGFANITIRIVPLVPKEFKEKFFFKIGHFEDAQVDIHVNSCSPQLLIDIPRSSSDLLLTSLHRFYPRIPVESAGQDMLMRVERELMIERFTLVQKSKKQRTPIYRDLQTKFIVSTFLVDFGDVTMGELKTKEYSLKSTSLCPFNFEINTSSLSRTGIDIEPTSFLNVQPQSEIKIKFIFDSNELADTTTKEINKFALISFSNDFFYQINITANISIPSLIFSTTSLEFDQTLVGQSRTQTVQIQNMNSIPIDFCFGQALTTNLLQRNIDKRIGSVFTATPNCETLPPSSFLNVDVTFSPNLEKNYQMQFNVKIKYNVSPVSFTLKGSGMQMKLKFDPPELQFDPIQPYGEPSYAEFYIVNPTKYQIEAYLPQFDLENVCEKLRQKYEEIHSQEIQKYKSGLLSSDGNTSSLLRQTLFDSKFDSCEQVEVQEPLSPNKVTMLSFCIIIHGPVKSGKTTVSKMLSVSLQNIPIISLNEIWKDDDKDDQYYIDTFRNLISDPSYLHGFIIDGLSFFKEPVETDQFIVHSTKAKGIFDEISKNPFTVVTSNVPTASEKALSLILSGLNGHYVFMIALDGNLNSIMQHEIVAEEEMKNAIEEKHKKELDEILHMTQDEYDALPPERQFYVDQKRKEHRDHLIYDDNETTLFDSTSSSNIFSTGRQNVHSRKRLRENEPKIMMRNRAPRKFSRKSITFNDPVSVSIAKFKFTLGSISQQLKNPEKPFQVLDLSKHMKNDESSFFITQENVLLVDVSQSIEEIQTHIINSMPSLEELVNLAEVNFIPPPRVFIPSKTECDPLNMPTIFTVVNEEPPGEFPCFQMEMTSPRTPANSKKKGRKIVDQSLSKGMDVMRYTKRWILEPNQREKIKVKFTVDSIGKFDDSLKFQIIDYRNDVFEMKLHGICDYPEIDRSLTTIFPKIVSRILFKTEFAYVSDIDSYYFGALLIGKERNQRSQQSAYRTSFNLKNITTFPVEINASLVESGLKSGWNLETPTIMIPPNETSQLTVGFNPTITEEYKNKLIITVKDNPTPLFVNLFGKGCIPQVECDPLILNFDRILLTQERTLNVDLSNVGKIPLFWVIKSPIPEVFSFEPEQGIINTRSKQSISVTFHSTKPIQFKKNLIINIMDKNKQKVFNTININTIAESFDVNFDFVFPKTMDHLSFGSMIVGESKTIVCQMRNKGKYPSSFTFLYAKKLYKKLFQIQPETGILPNNEKGISVSFTFQSNTNYHFENSKGITLEMKDTSTNTNIAEIPILFSVDSVYSSYSIEPPEILDFGDMPVDVVNSKHIKITNHGVFPFDFEISQIVNPEDEFSNSKKKTNKPARAAKSSNVMATSRIQNSRKKSPSMPNMKKKKIALQVDNFAFIAIKNGSILPNQSMTIEVDFCSRIQSSHESNVLFKIKNDQPGNNSGLVYKLKANSFIPGIVANDFEKIFPSQRLLLRYDLIKNDITSFLEDEKTLHFAPTIVNNSNSVKMALINPYPIESIVDISIHSKANMNLKSSKNSPSGTKKSSPSTSTDPRLRAFTISKNTVTIQPNSRELVDLIFTPKKSSNYANMIEFSVRGGIDLATNYLKFLVEGRGAIPSVGIVGTDGKIAQKAMNIPFGRTLIGTKKTKTVAIKNFGLVKNLIQFATKGSPDFTISVQGSNQKTVEVDCENPIEIEPGRLLNLFVSFAPSSTSFGSNTSSSMARKFQYSVQVAVIDHPKLNFNINFSGESFNEEIVFEGLTNEVLNSNSDIFFNNNIVGHAQSKSFWIRNLSLEKHFRFVWNETNEFHFSPCVGHLHAGKSKQITISFSATHPLTYHNQQIACKFTHIEFIESDSSSSFSSVSSKASSINGRSARFNRNRNNAKVIDSVPDWDDSMKTVKFIQPDQIPIEMLGDFSPEKIRPPSDDSRRTPNRARRNPARKSLNVSSSAKRRTSKAYQKRKSLMRNSPLDEYDSLQQQIQSQLDQQKSILDPIKVVEMKPEPLYTETVDRPKDIPLLVSAISDIIRYQLSTNQIVFNTTMMFDTRYITFDLKNTSSIRFEYTWVVTKFESLRTSYIQFHKVPFSVQPVSGVIEGGSTTTFTVYFTPEEVDDFNAYLKCEIPFLDEKLPEIFVSGFAKRPICHISAPISDYLSSGKRHSDYTYELSSDTKVIEIYSSGIGVKTYKVFEIINTTEMPYEVFWEEDKVHNNPSLHCETARAYISSGQHHSAKFSYKPASVKTIESVWYFLIPEHNVKVQVLIVGRIVPR